MFALERPGSSTRPLPVPPRNIPSPLNHWGYIGDGPARKIEVHLLLDNPNPSVGDDNDETEPEGKITVDELKPQAQKHKLRTTLHKES